MTNSRLPVKAVHCIEGTEYERGWGCRPDGNIGFLTKEAAEAYISEYHARHNNKPSAPDEYTVYAYAGLFECSPKFLAEVVEKGLKHFNCKQDLTDD